jgi:hypothetical protein
LPQSVGAGATLFVLLACELLDLEGCGASTLGDGAGAFVVDVTFFGGLGASTLDDGAGGFIADATFFPVELLVAIYFTLLFEYKKRTITRSFWGHNKSTLIIFRVLFV